MGDTVWREARLSDVAAFASGRTPSRALQTEYFDSGETPWVKTLDLTNGPIERTDESITDRAVRDLGMSVHAPGTVLVAMYGGFSQIGRTGVLRVAAATNQAITAVLPRPRDLDGDFLLHILNYKVDYWRSVASSSRKDPNITKDDVRAFPLLLPPLVEQERIAEALNGATEHIESLERMIAKKQAMKQGLMQQLLTGRARLPGFSKPWKETNLGDLGVFYKGRGVTRDAVQGSGVPCIRYGELYTAFQDYTAVTRSFVSDEVAATALAIRKGDLLFAASGETKAEIGMCVAYVGEEPAVAGGDIVLLRGSTFNPVFLAMLSNRPIVASQKASFGQGDAVVHIHAKSLAQVELSLPERDEQEAIAGILVDSDRELEQIRHRIAKARDIKTGMMQQLLTGRVRLGDRDAE